MARFRHLMLSALGVLALAAPTAAAAEDHVYAPLRMVTSFTFTMNPWKSQYFMQEFGQAEMLVQFREDGEVHPWLLSALGQKDDLTWVLTLRDNITFQNGKPLDAKAVKAAIDLGLEKNVSARAATPDSAVFTVTGPLELTVTSERPWPDLPNVLADESLFLIFDADAVTAAGEDWQQLVGAGIYTGPYSVVEMDDEGMRAEAYDGYWQGEPALPGMSLDFVSDANARLLAVQNDEADIALYPPLSARPAVEATPGMHFNIGALSTGGFIGYMNLNGALSDIALRRAILLGTDYREIAEDVFRGGLAQAKSLYPDNMPFAVLNYRTSADEAAALLDSAGWALGSEGVRHKDGAPLELVIATYPQQPDLAPLSAAVQAQYAKLGIAASIVSFDSINDAIADPSNRWDIAMISKGTAGYGRVQGFLDTYLLPGGMRNYVGYDNEEMTGLITALSTELDIKKRYEMLARIQTILWEEDPYAFAYNIHRGRVVVNDAYQCYQPGFALYHVSWQTAPCE